MIDAQQVQNSSLQIVYMNGVFNDVVTELIGLPEWKSFFDPATRQPDRETARMVVAAVIVFGEFTLLFFFFYLFYLYDH